jgi:hypothetical protein
VKIIHYVGQELMTGDAIADAVVRYAGALAQHETSASIDIPIVTEDGVVQASFLLGPASQLVAVPVKSNRPDPVDDELIDRIARETARLDPPRGQLSEDRREDRFDY